MSKPGREKLVLAYSVLTDATRHEIETNRALARWLAHILGLEYGGDYRQQNPHTSGGPQHREPAGIYLVPTQTIVGRAARSTLGLRGEADLLGGYVDHDFICTKAITHPLCGPDARSPTGWSEAFGRRVRDVVLRGFTVFSLADARRAGAAQLALGPMRIKPVHACGGRDQHVVESRDAFEALLADRAAEALFQTGVVLEEELASVTTHSVGQLRTGGLLLSYYGRQHTLDAPGTRNAYGGSQLLVARGDYADLLAVDLKPEERLAVEQARRFDVAANRSYPRFFASRRNYDIASGIDISGRPRSGVLEQSWRTGGATSAELAALEAFVQDPALRTVRASSVERYREEMLPPAAVEVFRGYDENVGFILKYATVERL